MSMAVHGQPAVAFRIGARAIELAGGFRQGEHQGIGLVEPSLGLRTMGIGGSVALPVLRVRSALRLKPGGLRNRGHGGTSGARRLGVRGGHHNAGAHQWILAQPADWMHLHKALAA